MLKLKCEKCGYRRASLKLCKKCGRTNPCPVKKLILQIAAPVLAVLFLLGAIWSAHWVAEFRADLAKAGATSFVAPREPQQPGKGRGRGGNLTWR